MEKESGPNTVWGPPLTNGIKPIGPARPFLTPEDDKRYECGVEEEADFISLAPIFNPANTSWPERNDVWGFFGSHTPRRASVGMHSRCSKRLLDAMYAEDVRGHHVGNEMAPQTVALLHGLKAVYAPMPMFFDREWRSDSLQKYFNPGPQGQSGSTEDSPFSKEYHSRFDGTTWFSRAMSPMRLYKNWLGRQENGIGGAEVCLFTCLRLERERLTGLKQWEKERGRMCLPPMLLRPIAIVDEEKSTTDHPTESALPESKYTEE